jgi:D-3-phosphoglycerate dehydrogenase
MSFIVVMTVPVPYPGVPHDEQAYEKIGVKFVKVLCQTEDQIIAAAQDADAVITLSQPFTRKVIENLNKCRLIHNLAIGYEGIDIKAATDNGICVSYPADYCLEEVSDHTIALIMCCARKIVPLFNAVKAGKWDSATKPEIRSKIWPGMSQLRDQTLGLIGFGNIPRTLAPKAKGLGLRVIAYDPYIPVNMAKELGVELVDLDQVLTQSDYVSVHAAATPESKHMLGLDELRKMKSTAYVINTARGTLIDEQALHTVLSEGKLAGAALDVLEIESCSPEYPLLKLDNVIITPHSAHYSDKSAAEIRKRPYEEISRMLRGEWPRCLINPEVKERFASKWQNGRS